MSVRDIRSVAVAVAFLAVAVGATAAGREPVIVIRAYEQGLSGVHAANPDVRLSVGRDAELAGESVLLVDYPQPTGDPAGRDVWCDAETTDWTAGRAISFRIKPATPVKLSLSFLDRNRVAYTTWIELQGGAWQTVQVSFDEMRPNPYFQPPDAKTGHPIDVSDVRNIGIAPQDRSAGHLAVSKFVVIE
jgi:hypothetical protein